MFRDVPFHYDFSPARIDIMMLSSLGFRVRPALLRIVRMIYSAQRELAPRVIAPMSPASERDYRHTAELSRCMLYAHDENSLQAESPLSRAEAATHT